MARPNIKVFFVLPLSDVVEITIDNAGLNEFNKMSNHQGIKGTFQKQTGLDEEALTRIGIELIERSRTAAHDSDHHRYHVGSSLLSIDRKGHETFADNANKIPDIVKAEGLTSHDEIGNGSPTVHGEFPLLYNATPAEHTFLGCNTPNCASCLKSAIMRDVDALFVDAASLPGNKGQNDDINPWTQDRADFWTDMCIPVARAAKIPIYAVNTETGQLSILVSGVPPSMRPQAEYPAYILGKNDLDSLQNSPDLFLSQARGRRSAIGVATDRKTGQDQFIFAEDSLPPGFSFDQDADLVDKFKDQHYHFPLDPIIHMMMIASKHNLELQNGKLLTNFIPSSGRQLDMAAIGISDVLFTKEHIPATAEAQKAMHDLSAIGAINYRTIKPQKGVKRMMDESFQRMDTDSTLEQ